MKKTKFTEAKIIFALKQAETGVTVAEVCRKMGICEATIYNWKKKYGGLGVSELHRLRLDTPTKKSALAGPVLPTAAELVEQRPPESFDHLNHSSQGNGKL